MTYKSYLVRRLVKYNKLTVRIFVTPFFYGRVMAPTEMALGIALAKTFITHQVINENGA
jgi:hypothetical protein